MKIGVNTKAIFLEKSCVYEHGLFTNGWETKSRDVWKPVSNRTPVITLKNCKLRGGTPALLRPVGTFKDLAWLYLGKNDSSLIKYKSFFQSTRDAFYILTTEVDWPGYE